MEKFSIDSLVDEMTAQDVSELIDIIFKSKHGFTVTDSMTKIFQGPNILTNTPMIKPNTNLNGYVFTVRPDLNLSTENLSAERKLMPLLTENANNVMRAIRCILSPQLGKRSGLTQRIETPLVNNNYPFIAISDNLTKSLTGWPSGQLGIRTTSPGVLKENHIMADGPALYNGEFSLNLSTHSMQGNPILFLYWYWILYISCVLYRTYGPIPWPEYFRNGRLDYTTRHYRLIMDDTNTYVTEIAATGYSIPRSVDMGPVFNYDSENKKPFIERSIEVEFACTGAIYLDEILIKQFNQTVVIFQPAMGDKDREKHFIKVTKRYQRIFNHDVYPRINPYTKELEWWMPISIWNNSKQLIEFVDQQGF